MSGSGEGSPGRGALALLAVLAAVVASAWLAPRAAPVALDATIARATGRLRAVNDLLEPDPLAARTARLRALVEDELGAPIPGAVEVVPVGREAWVEARVVDAIGRAYPTSEEQAEAWGEAQTDGWHRTGWTVATYDPARDRIELLAHHLLAEPDPGARGALLDLILAHELVHVWHARLHPSAPLLAGHDEPERAAAAAAAQEGHAQLIARRVARRLGLEDRFALVTPSLDRPHDAAVEPRERAAHLARLAPLVFRYRTGERWVAALVEEHGLLEATRRVLEQPPRTIAEVVGMEPAGPAPPLDPVARRIAASLGAPDAAVEPVLPGHVWLRLEALPDAETRAARVRRAVRLAVDEVPGPWDGARVHLALLPDARAAEEHARALLDAARQSDVLALPDAVWEARATEVDGDVVVRTVETADASGLLLLHGIAARGPVVVEVVATSRARDVGPFRRLLARTAAMAPAPGEDEAARRLRAAAAADEPAAWLEGLAHADPDVVLLSLRGLHAADLLDRVTDGRRADLRARDAPDLRAALVDLWPDDRAALHAADPLVRRVAAERVLRPVEALDDPDPPVRSAALRGMGADLVPARLPDLLDDPAARVRATALACAAEHGLLDDDALDTAARDALDDADPRVRTAGWTVLLRAGFGADADELVPPALLATAFDDPSPEVRRAVAARLGGLAFANFAATLTKRAERGRYLPALTRALRDPDPRVRAAALSALGTAAVFDGLPRQMLALLHRRRDDPLVRLTAPYGLEPWIGRDRRATDLAVRLLLDPFCYGRAARALAPDGFGADAIERAREKAPSSGARAVPRMPALRALYRELARHWDPGLRPHGLAALADLGEPVDPARVRAALAGALTGGSGDARAEAAEMVATLGEEARPLVPRLIATAVDTGHRIVLGRALDALRQLHAELGTPDAEAYADCIVRAYAGPLRSEVIDAATHWLRVGPAPPEAVVDRLAETLLPALDAGDQGERFGAVLFADALPERWDAEVGRRFAERIRVEDDAATLSTLARGRTRSAAIRAALETRVDDPDDELAAAARMALRAGY